MSDTIVSVENLSKAYLIGHQSSKREPYVALRDVIVRAGRNFARKAVDFVSGRPVVQGDEVEEIWALRDLNFEVKRGEILGLIGRNGAGKSTLLKILSRITQPTKGRVVLRGRLASLLEVGTGFHRELTGRENVFLNGAILGMTQGEIRKKFDEIIAFSGVEQFIDTPVKRYSSGMYVRLAFSVAAHLEPEILVVDEVLAVGDFEFQKKCLGKMDEVSRNEGRTVLFVSHNMDAVSRLCSRGIYLESGIIRAEGDIKTVVSTYFSNQSVSPRVVDLISAARPDSCAGNARLAEISPSADDSGWLLPFGHQLSLDISIDAQSSVSQVELAIAVFLGQGFHVATWANRCSNVQLPVRPGRNNFRIEFQNLRLLPGQYFLTFVLRSDRGGLEDYLTEALRFEVISSSEVPEFGGYKFGGAIAASAAVSILN